jgi:hypothetical protein
MNDSDGPSVARWFYEDVLSRDVIDANTIAYALDRAVTELRERRVPPRRWATFIHMGA